jgi:hypothetical protein
LTEHRLVAGVMRRKDDPNWVGIEEDVALIKLQLDVDRNRAHLESRCVATLSLHAIARRIQRHQDGSTESLMHEHQPARPGGVRRARGGRRLSGDDRCGRRRMARQGHSPAPREGRHSERAEGPHLDDRVMDSDALRLAKAQQVISAGRAMRGKAEHELRLARLEVTRLRRAVVSLQRQAQAREREVAA